MIAVNVEEMVSIPARIDDLDSFNEWVHSEEVPEEIRVSYLAGEVWIGTSREQVFSHNLIKTELFVVLGSLVKAGQLGRFHSDGVLLVNRRANLSTQPDGLFASLATLRKRRLQLIPGMRKGFVELRGTPDMVLEVVSQSSVRKDTQRLRKLYWKAGIAEYWLVDARPNTARLDILRHSTSGYVSINPQAGWVKSSVFGRAFRLLTTVDPLGDPSYSLEMRG